jgi:hypothetical protein
MGWMMTAAIPVPNLSTRAVARPYLLGAVQLELDTESASSAGGRRV